MNAEGRWAYIARTVETTKHHPAGTVVCATVDEPKMAKINAIEMAKWVRQGVTIERVPVEWVREHLFTTTLYAPELTP